MMGETLQALGYIPATDQAGKGMNARMTAARFVYRSYFSGKLWFKRNALIRKLRPALTSAEIDATSWRKIIRLKYVARYSVPLDVSGISRGRGNDV